MKLKSFIAMLLILAMATGTAATAMAEPVAMGRYAENAIELSQGDDWKLSLQNNAAGEAVFFGITEEKITRNTVESGQVVSAAVEWQNMDINPSQIRSIVERGDKTLVSYYDVDDGSYNTRVALVENGGFNELDLESAYRDMPFFQEIGFAGDLSILIGGYMQGVKCYDMESGDEIYSIDGADGRFIVQNGVVFAISMRDGVIIRADAKTGERLDDLTGMPLTDENYLAGDGESLYLANKKGIFRVAQSGSVWETMVDANLCSLRIPSYELTGFAMCGSEPLTLFFGDGKNTLNRYGFDASIPTVPSHELRAYTLYDNSTLTQAAAAFQKAHPDYLVNVTTLLSDDAGATKDDVIRALNTELLAGEGPDILLLDEMPIDSYIEKGVLADISEVVLSQDPLENVAGAFTTDGGVYAFPTSIVIPVLIGLPENLEKVDSLEDLCREAETWTGANAAMCKRTANGWFNILCPTCFPAWFGQDGSFNRDVFADFLRAVKSLSESCKADEDAFIEVDQYIAASSGSSIRQFPSNMLMNVREGMTHELARVADGDSEFQPMVLSGFILKMIELSIMENMSGDVKLLPGQTESGVFAPYGMIGVNRNSEQKDSAFEFIKTILSEEVQDAELYQGFPVNSKSMAKRVEREETDYTVGTTTVDDETGIEREFSGEWPKRQTRERVSELVKSANVAYLPDKSLLSIMYAELSSFFDGTEDADTAASRISSRLRAYLAE